MTGIPELKQATRARARLQRERAAAEAPRAPADVLRRLLAEVPVPAAAVVSGYWPIGFELDVLPLLRHFAREGHVCALPVGEGRGMPLSFRAWVPGDPLVAAGFGIMVPPPSSPAVTPRVVLVPLLAFDRAGYRLGYGAGYYDRTLAELRDRGPVTAVGVAYAGQEVPEVPRDEYDQRLDWLVTESFTLRLEPES
ncbi:MAG TPA: 5-formyltetrahydrofolate cyclo-ligase [Arenibaculum sp.]|nr:5-formyltetrahydrofolate cyclo-ligase [Arenibaculum sp.]